VGEDGSSTSTLVDDYHKYAFEDGSSIGTQADDYKYGGAAQAGDYQKYVD